MRIKSEASNGTSQSKDEKKEQHRISVRSRVNFIYLNDQEQVMRYSSLRSEYLELTKQID